MSKTYSIGVDLGGTNLRVAAYAGGTDFLETILVPTRLAEGRDRVVQDLCEAIQSLMGRDYGGRTLAGIGIGMPGPLELPEGILRNPPNLPGWDGFDFRVAVETALGRTVHLESDANLAALAEQVHGAGKTHEVDTLCALTLGTGVGSGIILNGWIWHGATGMGGEAGHIVVKDEGGAPCGCGGFGCLEQYASATAVVRLASERMGPAAPVTSHGVAQAAQAGDRDAIAVFDTVGHALAIGLTGLINTLNLPLFVIGGGVCEAWELFSPTMFRELRSRSYVYRLTAPEILQPEHFERHKTYILGAQLGPAAGLLGACLLPLRQSSSAARSSEELFVHQ